MKSIVLLSILFIFLDTQAQTGTEILFTKGAELEYRTYTSKPKGFKLELYETTNITLIVTDVKDSNNITYSYITKKGSGITNPEKDHYETKFVIARSSAGEITLPVNLYMIDTSYLSDKYSNKKKIKGYYAVAKPKETSDVHIFSVDLEKGKFSYSPKTITINFVVRDFMRSGTFTPGPKGGYDLSTTIEETKYSVTSTTNWYKIEGKTKVTTSAGSFDCYKITSNTESMVGKLRIESTSTVYYHPEIGYIKTEQADAKVQTGYIELVRVKK